MSMKCFVPNCKNTVGIPFPKDSDLKKKWLDSLKIKDVPNLSSFVCLDHFDDRDILKNANTDTETVRNGAVPVLLPCETTDEAENVDNDKQNDAEPNKYHMEVESSESSLEKKDSKNVTQKIEMQIKDHNNKQSVGLNTKIVDNQAGVEELTKAQMSGPPEVVMFDLNTKTCRLCTKEESVTKNIFIEKIENVPVSVAIMECIYPIEISKEDKLSKEICLTCLSSLRTYFKFRSICLENDKKQRDLHIEEQYYVNVDDSPNKQKRKNIESTFISENKKQRIEKYDTTDTEDDYDSDDFEPLNTFVIERNGVVSTNKNTNKQIYSLQKPEKAKGNLMMDKKLVNVEEELRKVLKGQLTEEQAKAENIIIHVENDDEAQSEKVVLKNLNLPIVIKPVDKNKLMKPSTSAPVSQRAIIIGDGVEFSTEMKNAKTPFVSQTGIFEGIPIQYVFNTEFCQVDGYLYEYRLCKGNLRFLRCVLPACPALGIQQKAGEGYSKKITVQNSHNHKQPDGNGMKKQMFYYVMKRKMQSDKSLNFKSVYEEVCSHDPDIKELVPLRNVINEICRHQLIHKMPPINSFKQFYEHVETDAFQKLHFTHNSKQFYQEKFTADDDCDSRAIVFSNMDIIEQVSHSTLMYVDASFKIDTNEEFNYQLVTVLVWVDESYYPILFALINKKTLSIYKKIFEYLHDTLAPKLQPVEIVTDYEANLYYALGETYLDSSIGGSVFYYTQNLYKKICSLNLSRELETNSYFRNIYHMLLMLPLLPVNTILDGLNNMEIQARDLGLSELTRAIFDHVRTEWILKVSADLFCVHRLENRINENVIAPFKKLRDFIMLSKGKIQKQNISIVNVVEKLIELEHFLQVTYSAPNKKSFARDLSSSQKKNVLKAWQYIESHPKININNFFSKVLGYIKCMENQLWIWGFYRYDGDVTEELINASNFSIISNGIEVIVQNDGEVTEETECVEEEETQQSNEQQSEKGQIVMEAVIDENGSFVLQNTGNNELGTQLNSLLKYVYKE